RQLASVAGASRLLVLTHTHAACSVFSRHTVGTGTRVEIRTIDSLIARIAAAYHAGLGLPADTATWVRRRENGHSELATRVAALLQRHPLIATALARRYPVVLCDEHQDSSGDQHAVAAALHVGGARLRLFADPMQRIFRERKSDGCALPPDWDD